MLRDWNRNEVKPHEVFHFKNSLEPFIAIEDPDNPYGMVFLNINTNLLYTFDKLDCYDYSFYTKDDDDDFLGVKIDGKIEWVGAE